MSIAASPVGAEPIAAHGGAAPATAPRPPRKRQVTARTDSISDPEAR